MPDFRASSSPRVQVAEDLTVPNDVLPVPEGGSSVVRLSAVSWETRSFGRAGSHDTALRHVLGAVCALDRGLCPWLIGAVPRPGLTAKRGAVMTRRGQIRLPDGTLADCEFGPNLMDRYGTPTMFCGVRLDLSAVVSSCGFLPHTAWLLVFVPAACSGTIGGLVQSGWRTPFRTPDGFVLEAVVGIDGAVVCQVGWFDDAWCGAAVIASPELIHEVRGRLGPRRATE